MKYPASSLEQIRQRTSLVEEVRRAVPDLKRKGKFWWGCCPFHSEKTPSFHVREDDAHYHCFGCGAHGDVFTFVMETRGGTFSETVEHLANQAGVDLPKEKFDPKAEKLRNDGLKALARTQTFYQRHLSSVSQYIEKRGFSEETIKEFGIGFAPDSWDETRTAMLNEGFSPEVLRETGLSIESNKKATNKNGSDYDRFRGRLMFPIHDLKDNIIAFGGRIIGDGEPKYLNSPETPFFNKSYVLYNLNRARTHIRQENTALLVEGYVDAISLWQAGIKTAVAPMGTAVTPEQIQLLWQYNNAPIVCLDGDTAGRNAAIRLAKRILPVLAPSKTLRFVWLPDEEDPDSFIKTQGKKAFNELLKDTQSIEDILWNDITKELNITSGDGRAQIEEAIQNLARDIKNETVRRSYAGALKDRLWKARSKNFKGNAKKLLQAPSQWVPKPAGNQLPRQVLALVCKNPYLIATYAEELADIPLSKKEDKQISQILMQAFLEKRLEQNAFNAYLQTCGMFNAVNNLCKQTMVEGIMARITANKQNVTDVFETYLAQALQSNRSQNKRQKIWTSFCKGPTEENWKNLQSMLERTTTNK